MSHYLITGHTGFKGSWLALLLSQLGHEVSGVSLDPEPRSLFSHPGLHSLHMHDIRVDIRDAAALASAMRLVKPDVVIHLAAQPLVRRSFVDPRETVETNTIGTFNVLSSIQEEAGVKAVLIATTDKVYRPTSQRTAYRESDPLGGEDIYSASKAMADLLTSAWVRSFDAPPTAIARAGNVIGGGDHGVDRLVPDLVSAFVGQRSPKLRYPNAVRPWQHVLDCLMGYLAIVSHLQTSCPSGAAETWNVGPDQSTYTTVADLTSCAAAAWGAEASWTSDAAEQHPENQWLTLNTDKIRTDLEWRDTLDLATAVNWTMAWYRKVLAGADPVEVTLEQIQAFLSASGQKSLLGATCEPPHPEED